MNELQSKIWELCEIYTRFLYFLFQDGWIEKKGKTKKLPRSGNNSAILRLPSKRVQEIVNGDTKLKYLNWALPRLDKITGIKYRLKTNVLTTTF